MLPIVEAELQVQHTIALRREGAGYRVFAWSGFDAAAAESLAGATIHLPSQVEEGEGILVTKTDPEEPWLVATRKVFGFPVFVAVPVDGPDHVLVIGRQAEGTGFYPRFDRADVDALLAVAELVASAVRNTQMAALSEMRRFLPPSVVEELMSGRMAPDAGYERREVTILAVDMVGFTSLAETLKPDDLAELLNAYLRELTSLANANRGTVGSLAGDGGIVLFGAPEVRAPADSAWDAARAAFAMHSSMDALSRPFRSSGAANPKIRVGINTGWCSVGVFGSDAHRTYTALGLPVNLAARLEGAAEPGEVLVSPSTLGLLDGRVNATPRERLQLKGISEPVTAYALTIRR